MRKEILDLLEYAEDNELQEIIQFCEQELKERIEEGGEIK